MQRAVGVDGLACAAGSEQDRLREVVIHAAQLLCTVSGSPSALRMSIPTCVGASPLRVEVTDVARFLPMMAAVCVRVEAGSALQKARNTEQSDADDSLAHQRGRVRGRRPS